MKTTDKPMTGEQLDELMTVATNMQRDSEKAGERPVAMFAYAVQVAVLELRQVREMKTADENHVAAMNSIKAIIAILGSSDTLGISEQVAELKAQRDALSAENAELKAFKTAVYQQMGAGCEAPEFSITEGLSNLRRFTDTLHAIEREFFTKEVPDEECEGEAVEECPLGWGMSVEQYVYEFRKCLAEVRAQGVQMFAAEMGAIHAKCQAGGYFDRQVQVYGKAQELAESYLKQRSQETAQ